jgi:hypothetical protein
MKYKLQFWGRILNHGIARGRGFQIECFFRFFFFLGGGGLEHDVDVDEHVVKGVKRRRRRTPMTWTI